MLLAVLFVGAPLVLFGAFVFLDYRREAKENAEAAAKWAEFKRVNNG